jgi:signal transduction histidine kinase
MQIEIIDNGVGFIPSEKSDSNGIKNIISRAKLLDGIADFISVSGKGTIVKVKIPIYDNE